MDIRKMCIRDSSQTAPLVEYYTKAGNLAVINGDQPMDSVFSDITKVLGE